MKNTSTPVIVCLCVTVPSLFAVTVAPNFVPFHFNNVVCVADTTRVGWADNMIVPSTPAATFQALGRPVIDQNSANIPRVAFAGRVALVPSVFTAANDEGVWSDSCWTKCRAVLQEGAPIPFAVTGYPGIPQDYGWAGALSSEGTTTMPAVENLQITSLGAVVCQTYASSGGKAGVIATIDGTGTGNSQHIGISNPSGGGVDGAVMLDRRPPVVDVTGNFMAQRERWTLGADYIKQFVFNPPVICGTILPHDPWKIEPCFVAAAAAPPPAVGKWTTAGGFTRSGSPTISSIGTVGIHALDSNTPLTRRAQIHLVNHLGVREIVMREDTACGPGLPNRLPIATRFGHVSPSLTSLSTMAGETPDGLVAWKMNSMRNAGGAILPNSASIWCKQNGTFLCLLRKGQPAPSIPAQMIKDFVSLHAIDFPGSAGKVYVAVSVELSTKGKHAIYLFGVQGGVIAAGDDLLLATNVGSITQLAPYSGPADLTALDPYFSSSTRGDITFSASIAAAPGMNRVLVTASQTEGFARRVRAQSGVTTFVDCNATTRTMTNIFLATPDQGTFSRGQAIGYDSTFPLSAPGSLVVAWKATYSGASQQAILKGY
jgi:hypothetical protein